MILFESPCGVGLFYSSGIINNQSLNTGILVSSTELKGFVYTIQDMAFIQQAIQTL